MPVITICYIFQELYSDVENISWTYIYTAKESEFTNPDSFAQFSIIYNSTTNPSLLLHEPGHPQVAPDNLDHSDLPLESFLPNVL